jgi:SAM-dependent methyltransferase
VLDVGCGAGRFVHALAGRGACAVGVDLSAPLLHVARDGGATAVGFVRADMRALPFAAASFEVVLSMFTSFGYFATVAEDRLALGEMMRVLRPGGDFVLDFLNAERVRAEASGTTVRRVGDYEVHETRRLDAAGERVLKEIEVRGGAVVRRYREEVRLWSAADLHAALRHAGCRIVQCWGDYAAAPFVPATSPRLVLHAERGPA